MERLTTNKDVSEMGMLELAHNSCYIKDGVARYRDFETDIDARDLARELAWSLADIELPRDDNDFDEEMRDNLQFDIMQTKIGLIALFYRNLWAMADLREKLKEYEDTGLTPEQLKEIDRMYLEQAKELGEYKKAEENSYNRGMNNAWDLAKKIAMLDLTLGELRKIFNIKKAITSNGQIFSLITPQEAREMLKAYEKKQINVNEVVYNPNTCRYALVLKINRENQSATVIELYNGRLQIREPFLCALRKTGKYIDIKGMLDEISAEYEPKSEV